jgi:hypothetical protein
MKVMQKKLIIAAALGALALTVQADVVLFQTVPTGNAGTVYSTFNADTTYNTNYLKTGVAQLLSSSASPQTAQMVVAGDGTGVTEVVSPWWEAPQTTQGSRTAFQYTLRSANVQPSSTFTLTTVDLTLSGVTGNGITATLYYELPDTTWVPVAFNSGNNMISNGVYTVDLSSTGLTWTDSSGSLYDTTGNFRVSFTDPLEGGGTGNAVVESVTVNAIIPEPATLGMLGLGALVTLVLRRMRA